jgi:plastocyanin
MFSGRTRIVAAAVAAVLALSACSGAEPSGNVSSGPGGRDAIRLSAIDFAFRPGRLDLPAGKEVEIQLKNGGAATHDFTIESLDLSTGPIEAGAMATARFVVPKGETAFVCSLHGGMDGVIYGA